AGASVEYKKIKSSTLADLLNHYQTHVIPTRRNPTQEKQRIKHWLATSLAKRPLDSLAAIDFARYRDSRKRAGRADNTIRLELALVGRIESPPVLRRLHFLRECSHEQEQQVFP